MDFEDFEKFEPAPGEEATSNFPNVHSPVFEGGWCSVKRCEFPRGYLCSASAAV